MKIEEGKFYRTRDGRKVGPIMAVEDENYAWIADVEGATHVFMVDGLWDQHSTSTSMDIIAEWTDEPTFDPLDPPAFGELTDAQAADIWLHWRNGGEVECFTNGEVWQYRGQPTWSPKLRYRKKPEPVRETVTFYGRFLHGGWNFRNTEKFPGDTHALTMDTIDGKPVCDSIKMEEM